VRETEPRTMAQGETTQTPTLEDAERRGAERSEGPRSGVSSNVDRRPGTPPDPQVPAKAQRRRFSAKFKLQVLREADRCTKAGDVGALLRRYGIYSSHLSTWRRERDRAAGQQLEKRKRGRKPAEKNPLAPRLAKLERENRRLQGELKKAELIIDIQKKASALLGIPLKSLDSDGND